jgi:hypothetical protein
MWGREAGFSTAQLAKAQAASVEMTILRVGEISKSNNQKQTQQAKTKQKQRQKQKCSACTVSLRTGHFSARLWFCGVEDYDGGDGVEGLGWELDVEAFAGLGEFERFVRGVG